MQSRIFLVTVQCVTFAFLSLRGVGYCCEPYVTSQSRYVTKTSYNVILIQFWLKMRGFRKLTLEFALDNWENFRYLNRYKFSGVTCDDI